MSIPTGTPELNTSAMSAEEAGSSADNGNEHLASQTSPTAQSATDCIPYQTLVGPMTLNLRMPPFPPRADTPTVSVAPPAPAHDLAQYADNLGRSLHLQKSQQEELLRATQIVDPNRQFIYMVAQLLFVKGSIELLQPASAPIAFAANLESKIDELAVMVILDPTAGAYKSRPTERIMAGIRCYPDILTPALRDHKPTLKALKAKAGNLCTHHRADIKLQIARSLGDFNSDIKLFIGPFVPIVELTTAITNEVNGRAAEVKVSLPLVARIAFLRNIFVSEAQQTSDGKVGAGYWDAVDKGLEFIRESHKNNKVQISGVFARILQDDRTKYQSDFTGPMESLDGLEDIAVDIIQD
ncbi:hypothetical protein D9758_013978 [Tetrapyrgos nigripes]|uniref:Uncharacterized protein n=1 Tax=Tetrapyrgos nigripes TaxID=182062 RepID=A0A8H5LK20_9AGAR|nr:hypothetical protein D9758_013978 [Tetrapyrgos nigripes]